MSLRRTLGALGCALALSVSLAACGGTPAPAGPDLAALRDDFVGSWGLESAEFSDGAVSAEDIDAMEDLGMRVTLDLDDQGNLLVDAFGEQQEGSWEIKDETTLSLTLEDETVDVPFEDEQLTLTYDGETMVFEKVSDTPEMDRDPSENAGGEGGFMDQLEGVEDELGEDMGDGAVGDDATDDSVSDDIAEMFSDETMFMMDAYVNDVTELEPMDVTVCDDEVAAIHIYATGEDYEGDTGYLMTIENRSGVDFIATNLTTTLDGVDVYDEATLGAPVRAGETSTSFFYFDTSVGAVTSASACEFTIGIVDVNENILGIYDASL